MTGLASASRWAIGVYNEQSAPHAITFVSPGEGLNPGWTFECELASGSSVRVRQSTRPWDENAHNNPRDVICIAGLSLQGGKLCPSSPECRQLSTELPKTFVSSKQVWRDNLPSRDLHLCRKWLRNLPNLAGYPPILKKRLRLISLRRRSIVFKRFLQCRRLPANLLSSLANRSSTLLLQEPPRPAQRRDLTPLSPRSSLTSQIPRTIPGNSTFRARALRRFSR